MYSKEYDYGADTARAYRADYFTGDLNGVLAMAEWQRPELLYHYTPRERAIENIFLDGKIRLGKLTLTNDPQETAVGGFGISAHANEVVDLNAIFAECMRLTTKPVRLACFTQTYRDPSNTSSIPGCDHDRMWAQYAGNNSGVCIAFNKDRLTANVERYFETRQREGKGLLIHGPVEYVSEVPIQDGIFFGLSSDELNTDGIKARRNERATQRYLRKTVDWASEHEYRYVWIDADDDYDKDGEFIPIGDCVESIFLGARFPEPYNIITNKICAAYRIGSWQVTYGLGHRSIVPRYVKRDRIDEDTPDGPG